MTRSNARALVCSTILACSIVSAASVATAQTRVVDFAPITLTYDGPAESMEPVRAALQRELGRPVILATPRPLNTAPVATAPAAPAAPTAPVATAPAETAPPAAPTAPPSVVSIAPGVPAAPSPPSPAAPIATTTATAGDTIPPQVMQTTVAASVHIAPLPAGTDHVEVRLLPDGTVAVRFVRADGAARAREVVAPPQDAQRTAVWLAGNLVRDESAGLLAQLNGPPAPPLQPIVVNIVVPAPQIVMMQPAQIPAAPTMPPLELLGAPQAIRLTPPPPSPPPSGRPVRYFGIRTEFGAAIPLGRPDLTRFSGQLGLEYRTHAFTVGLDASYSGPADIFMMSVTALGTAGTGIFTVGLGASLGIAVAPNFSWIQGVFPQANVIVRPSLQLTRWLDAVVDLQGRFLYSPGYGSFYSEVAVHGGLRWKINI